MDMVLKNRYRDEFPELRATIEATPPPVRRPFKAAYPGVAVDALALMRSLDGPVPPTALRDAFDRGAWLPASVGIASVPLVEPRPDADFWANYHADLDAEHAMRDSVQVIRGILFESDEALEAIIVDALLPIVAELALIDAELAVAL